MYSKVHECAGIAKIRLAIRFPYNNNGSGETNTTCERDRHGHPLQPWSGVVEPWTGDAAPP